MGEFFERLTPKDLLDIVHRAPEQSRLDCKSTLRLDTHYLKAELIKDIVAIANSPGKHIGYLFFGVDLSATSTIVGLTGSFDDATLQKIVAGKVDRPVGFLYYELDVDGAIVGVLEIPRSRRRPHVIRVDYEHLHEGTILIRRGSSTAFANADEIRAMSEDRVKDDRQELRELILLSNDDTISTSTLALQAWDLFTRLGATEDSQWIRTEITGFPDDADESDIPEYRYVEAYARKTRLQPNSLAVGTLQTLVSLDPRQFTEIKFLFHHPISQLGKMIQMPRKQGDGVLYVQADIKTVGGGLAPAWVYMEPQSISWMITRIRDEIARRLMNIDLQ